MHWLVHLQPASSSITCSHSTDPKRTPQANFNNTLVVSCDGFNKLTFLPSQQQGVLWLFEHWQADTKECRLFIIRPHQSLHLKKGELPLRQGVRVGGRLNSVPRHANTSDCNGPSLLYANGPWLVSYMWSMVVLCKFNWKLYSSMQGFLYLRTLQSHGWICWDFTAS